jgi:microcystin-dependent protein
MAEPFLSEIRLVSFNYPPKGWAFANGQTLPINQNQAIFALMGTTYGGNGQTTFQLPNLQGRVIVGQGAGYLVGEVGGEASHTLTINEMPNHTHTAKTGSNSAIGTHTDPHGQSFNIPAVPARLGTLYSLTGGSVAGSVVSNSGGSQPHDNMQPYLTLSYIIALQGIFPSQN